MKYNPEIHHRRSAHIKEYDYAQGGLYYITICCANLQSRFGTIAAEDMQLNECGKFAHNLWAEIPQRFPNCELYAFSIMPNHLHGIIRLTAPEGNLAAVITAYKSQVSAECLNIYKSRNEVMGKIWQRDFEYKIIKDDRAFGNISESIRNNPARWHTDEFYKPAV